MYEPIKIRIVRIAKEKGLSMRKFEEICQLGRGNISNMKDDGSIGSDKLSKIIDKMPDVSAKWLLTGRGSMLETAHDPTMHITNLQPTVATVAQQSIPVYDLQIGSQHGSLFDGGLTPINYISLPNLPQCDGAMVLYGGDTMTPALETGDILVYRRVKDIRKGLFLGHMYIVTFELEGEEYLMVRRIEQSENKDSLKLVSNRVSQDILFDSIKGMAMVKASIRRYEP